MSDQVPVAAGLGRAVPPEIEHERLWTDYFAAQYAAAGARRLRAAERIWRSVGVRTRHAAVDPRREDVASWPTSVRMRRFLAEVLPLGKAAVTDALADAGVSAGDAGLFVVATCTGYGTPGPDILLARDLGMPAQVQRLLVGHMGCYAALPGLAAAADHVRAHGRPAVLLAVELPSLHVQPAVGDDLPQVVAHALFSDAAAAVVLTPGGRGLEVVDVVAVTDSDSTAHMTWEVTDLGFRMGLSPEVPDVLARHVGPAVHRLLGAHGLRVGDVAGWAVHPGGPRILDVVAGALGLPRTALAASTATLAADGNCSSATVLLVLGRLRPPAGWEPGEHVVALAFGPGLTLYAALLRGRVE